MKNFIQCIFIVLAYLSISGCIDDKACIRFDLDKGYFQIDQRDVHFTSLAIYDPCNEHKQIFALLSDEHEKHFKSSLNLTKDRQMNGFEIIGSYGSLDTINCENIEINIRARKSNGGRFYSFYEKIKLGNKNTFKNTMCSQSY